MKTCFILCLFLILCTLGCKKEIVPAEKSNSGIRYFGGNNTDLALKIIKTRDGDYAICGLSRSFNGGHQTAYLLKVDANLNLIWQKTFETNSRAVLYDIIQTKDEGFLVCGVVVNFKDSVTGENRGIFPIIIKIDKNGLIQWKKFLELETTGSGSELRSIIEETDNHYVFAGICRVRGATQPSIITIDKNGNLVHFIKNITPSFGFCTSAIRNLDGSGNWLGAGFVADETSLNLALFNFDKKDSIISYTFFESIRFEEYFWTRTSLLITPDNNYLLITTSKKNAIICKIDATGNKLWQLNYRFKNLNTIGFNAKVNNKGEIFLCGHINEDHAFFTKFDANGNVIYEKRFFGDIISEISDFWLDENGTVTLVGFTLKAHDENTDIIVFRIDSKGEIIYE